MILETESARAFCFRQLTRASSDHPACNHKEMGLAQAITPKGYTMPDTPVLNENTAPAQDTGVANLPAIIAAEKQASPLFGGQSLSEALRRPQPAQEKSNAPLPKEEITAEAKAVNGKAEVTSAEGDGPSAEIDEPKLAPMRGVDLSGLEGFEDESGDPEDESSVDRIIEKYKGEPKELAKALLNFQRLDSQKSRGYRELQERLDRLESRRTERDEDEEEEQPKRKVGRPEGSKTKIDLKAEFAKIEKDLYDEKIDSATAAEMKADLQARLAEQRIEARLAEEEKRRAQDNEERVNIQNARVYHDRAKDILAEQSRRMGKTTLAAKYEQADYELTEAEYRAAQGRLTQEYELITSQFRIPESGVISKKIFERAALMLDPKDYEQQIRADERKKMMASLKKGKPNGTKLDTGSGASVLRAPVTNGSLPASIQSKEDAQEWYLRQPKEVRERVKRERGIR